SVLVFAQGLPNDAVNGTLVKLHNSVLLPVLLGIDKTYPFTLPLPNGRGSESLSVCPLIALPVGSRLSESPDSAVGSSMSEKKVGCWAGCFRRRLIPRSLTVGALCRVFTCWASNVASTSLAVS